MLATMTPSIQAVTRARTVGVDVFNVIDRHSSISDVPNALKTCDLKDKIVFKGITFRYPTAPASVKNVL